MTKLTLELDHEIYSVQFKNPDVGTEQYMTAFLSLLVGSFAEETVLKAMKDFAEELLIITNRIHFIEVEDEKAT